MKKRILLSLLLIVTIISFINVRAYDYDYKYVNESNKTPVELKREEIYRLNEMYDSNIKCFVKSTIIKWWIFLVSLNNH